MTDIPYKLASVRSRIAAACKAAGRPESSVGLLAVSKTFGAAEVRQAQAAGQRAFGENYLQEALDKQAELTDLPLEWHFIGPVQSNKTRSLAERFDWVHGVERLKIAQRLSDQRPPGLPPLNICVQVNVSGEASKAGCTPAEALELCRAVATLPRLRLRGLMAIPAPAVDSATAAERQAPFRALRELFGELRRAGLELDTISAGMSDDLEDAIAEGSTLVRVGSSIFGSRPPKA
ncbi:YggS family pyridoxal phosphate-dependent enzyme [Solimonas sp. SE-A11]|uniref:YggS family pyridoxal phosphate-dependent enzyme n=1 Tax=Solimonas sp. SE-A11 TaxID=3054954 RepID=UPI00259CF54E|nr:YggS family pyridoxal phosphate-dependent enzyme [Solimonas sp. SE-A11]MDM4772269.1 YggS family pyridoxal phosphate-dependent enzyme [Solimonas sp. SE-A11]